MIKAKVVKRFRDKTTKKIHKKGTIIEITKERLAEINGTPLGVFVEEVVKKAPKKTASKTKK